MYKMCAVAVESESGTSGAVYKCNRCGHMWVTRKSDGLPHSCPACRSVIWNKPCKTVHCLRCDHEWTSTKGRPSRCPNCHTARWDVPIEPYVTKVPTTKTVTIDPVVVDRVKELYAESKNAFKVACDTGLSYQTVRMILGPCDDSKE